MRLFLLSRSPSYCLFSFHCLCSTLPFLYVFYQPKRLFCTLTGIVIRVLLCLGAAGVQLLLFLDKHTSSFDDGYNDSKGNRHGNFLQEIHLTSRLPTAMAQANADPLLDPSVHIHARNHRYHCATLLRVRYLPGHLKMDIHNQPLPHPVHLSLLHRPRRRRRGCPSTPFPTHLNHPLITLQLPLTPSLLLLPLPFCGRIHFPNLRVVIIQFAYFLLACVSVEIVIDFRRGGTVADWVVGCAVGVGEGVSERRGILGRMR